MTFMLLTKREAAERARIGESTMNKVLSLKKGPTITRLGGRVFIRDDHLAAWIERNAESTP